MEQNPQFATLCKPLRCLLCWALLVSAKLYKSVFCLVFAGRGRGGAGDISQCPRQFVLTTTLPCLPSCCCLAPAPPPTSGYRQNIYTVLRPRTHTSAVQSCLKENSSQPPGHLKLRIKFPHRDVCLCNSVLYRARPCWRLRVLR